MSASVGGHGGIEGEDRALSCLSVHMLCFRHLHECVGAFVLLSTHHITLLVYLSVFDYPVVIVHLSVSVSFRC